MKQLGEQIDAIAKTFVAELMTEEERLSRLVGVWESAKRAKAAEEEKKRVEEAVKISASAASGTEQEKAAAQQQVMALVAAAPEAKTKGVTLRKVPHFEVLDINILFAAKPMYCEIVPRTALINTAILRGEVFPGLKCWVEEKAGAK